MRGWAKMSPESEASNKVSTRQPPAPIFLSDLDNRTRPAPDCHIQDSYADMKNLEKSCNFKAEMSKSRWIWKNK